MTLEKVSQRRTLRFIIIYVILVTPLLIFFGMGLYSEGNGMEFFYFFLAVCTSPLIAYFIRAILGLNTKALKAYYKTPGSLSPEELYQEYEKSKKFQGAALLDDILIIGKTKLNIIPYSQLVWVYQFNQTTNGITTYSLVIVNDKKKKYMIVLGKKRKSMEYDDFIQKLCEKQPNVIVGFNAQLEALYVKDFDKMVQISRGVR